MKKKILLLLSVPPPMHGSNLMNQCVINCSKLYESFDVSVLPMRYVKKVSELRKVRLRKIGLMFFYMLKLFSLLTSNKPDVIYFVPAIAGLSFYRDCIFAAISKMLRVKIVYHLHGKGIREAIKKPFNRSIYRWFFRKSDVIHLSPLLFEDVQNVVKPDQMHYVPNGVADGTYSRRDKNRTDILPLILFLSNLAPTKGPLILLEALYLLKKRGYHFRSIFAGSETRDLSAIIFKNRISNLGLKECVSYVGPKYSEEKADLFKNADLFVFPTLKETWGLVILEAMSYGLPVISTSEGAIPEIVADNITGFIIKRNTPEELAEKIVELLKKPELRTEMGKKARLEFESKYTLEVFGKNINNVLNSIMS